MNEIKFEENIYNIIRKNIKKYRKERRMTAQQLADLVNRSHDFIRQIEIENSRYNFSVETLYRISVALNVPLNKFVEK